MGCYIGAMEIVLLLLFLALPAAVAWLTRTTSGALTVACVPGAFCLFSLSRLWEMSSEHSGGCGMGAGIVLFCAFLAGISASAALLVAFLRYSRRAELLSNDPPEIGFTAGH